MDLSRQHFSGRTFLTGLGVVLVGDVRTVATSAPLHVRPTGRKGYGHLIPDPAGLLSLPEGFSYTVVTDAGATQLDSGEPTPQRHAGMATFPRTEGGCVIVYNHKIEVGHHARFQVPRRRGLTYDEAAPGGCTVVEVDDRGRRIGERVGLAGTSANGAGGSTPWNTWLSCEKTEDRAGQNGLLLDHGYVFEVDPYQRGANRSPKPIKALGRFAHEAVIVDLGTGHIYQTEDAASPNGLFYRYTPPASAFPLGPDKLHTLGDTGGILEAMKASAPSGEHMDDLSQAIEIGTKYHVEWVAVQDRNAATTSIRKQFTDGQVTRVRKLEGAWWDQDGYYFVSGYTTTGSPATPHDGQVWCYDPLAATIELRLRFAYDDSDLRDGRITVCPYSGLVLAADISSRHQLAGATVDGATFSLARNELIVGTADEPEFSEFCGPVYSPSGEFLFVNVPEPGITYAINGPWARDW